MSMDCVPILLLQLRINAEIQRKAAKHRLAKEILARVTDEKAK